MQRNILTSKHIYISTHIKQHTHILARAYGLLNRDFQPDRMVIDLLSSPFILITIIKTAHPTILSILYTHAEIAHPVQQLYVAKTDLMKPNQCSQPTHIQLYNQLNGQCSHLIQSLNCQTKQLYNSCRMGLARFTIHIRIGYFGSYVIVIFTPHVRFAHAHTCERIMFLGRGWRTFQAGLQAVNNSMYFQQHAKTICTFPKNGAKHAPL